MNDINKRKIDIINSAIKEFSTKGYDNASINTIIEDSKTSKGTFYHYFKSKEDLFFYIIDYIINEKIEFIKNQQEKEESNDNEKNNKEKQIISGNIFDLFKSQIDKTIDFCLAYPEYTLFTIQARKETNVKIKQLIYTKLEKTSKEYYITLIKQNIKLGFIRDDLPEELIISVLSYLLTHFIEFVYHEEYDISIDNREFIKQRFMYYIDFIEKGLRKK